MYCATDSVAIIDGRTYLRCQVIAVGDGARNLLALQADWAHRRDVGVGTILQAVLERRRSAVAPAPDATDVLTITVHTIDGASEDTVLDGSLRVQAMADEAASIVAADVERGGDGAALYRIGAIGKTYDSCCVEAGGGDGACHCQVLDGGILDVVERSHTLLIHACTRRCAVDIGSQRLAVAVEDTAEGMVFA